jgi:hypothetical protein
MARIYGVYTLKTNVFSPVSFMIMQNVSKMQSKHNQKLTFDLKGSYINRHVSLSKNEQELLYGFH